MLQSSANKIVEPLWESHKKTIQRLYLSEDKSLRDLMKIMEDSYDFSARYPSARPLGLQN